MHVMTKEGGYTLIELMVVVAIAGILVTLAQPSFVQSVQKAREAALKQNLLTMREVLDQYRADHGRYPGDLDELKAAGYLKRIPIDPITKSDETWQKIEEPGESGVYDVHSGSEMIAMDGTPYNQW